MERLYMKKVISEFTRTKAELLNGANDRLFNKWHLHNYIARWKKMQLNFSVNYIGTLRYQIRAKDGLKKKTVVTKGYQITKR